MACLSSIESRRRRAWRAVGLTLCAASCTLVAFSVASCTPTAYTTAHHNDEGGIISDDPGDPNLNPPRPPDYENDDSGSLDLGGGRQKDAGGRPVDGGGRNPDDGGQPPKDGGSPPVDSGSPSKLCAPTLAVADVKIVEIMISAAAGSGDKGEWVEIQNTHGDCSVNVKGLTISSPRGDAGVDTVTIASDLVLAPNGIFVVADTSDTSITHLTGPIFVWNSSDVLKNSGDTINLFLGSTLIDTLTYPSFTDLSANVGRSVSFPSDCAWSDRSSWANWSYSFADYYLTTLEGTPNTDNNDVTCF